MKRLCPNKDCRTELTPIKRRRGRVAWWCWKCERDWKAGIKASFPYMAKIDGTWHTCRPLGDQRPAAFPVETECGKKAEEGEHLHEAPAFARAGGEEDRCEECPI